MSSLSSWSLSDLFILLLLAILRRGEKRKGQGYHQFAHYFTEKYLRPKYSLPSAPYTCPTGPHHGTDCIGCVSLVQAAKSSHRRLAIRLLFRPIPRHFSRWGAKRDAAILRLQLGQTHSLLFHWLKTCPKMSNPGWSTISGGRRGVAIRAGRVPSSCSLLARVPCPL